MCSSRLAKFILLSWLVLASSSTIASPASSHLGSPKDALARMDNVKAADFGTKVGKTVLANVLTEPLIRILWAGQIVNDSDWIGIQALGAANYRFDPGGKDDANNMFVYTCKGGWVDFGHMMANALGYKVTHQALRGSPVADIAMKKMLHPGDIELYSEVRERMKANFSAIKKAKDKKRPFSLSEFQGLVAEATEFRIRRNLELTSESKSEVEIKKMVAADVDETISFLNKQSKSGVDLEVLYYGFWSGYFALQLGYAVEYTQNERKETEPKENWHGVETSAWTLEDMPSDFYGVMLGASLERKAFVGSVRKQMKVEVADILDSLGAVDLDNVTKVEGCGDTAKDVLGKDARFYGESAEAGKVTFSKADSFDANSPYNYTIYHKNTRSHACVCDENNNPINRALPERRIAEPVDKKEIKRPKSNMRKLDHK